MLQILTIALVTLTVACNKDSSNPLSKSNDPVTPGTYVITLFTDNSNGNITSQYSTYTFQFNSDNTITATNGVTTTTGTWSQRNAHENEAAKLEISFNNGPLEKLDKGWEVISITSTTISLRDDDTSSNEALTFQKQ